MSLGAPAAATARPATTGTAAAAAPLIRVAEIGYPQAGSKRAYLMTSAGESGAGYAVLRAGDGAVAFSGTVGASLGAWNTRYRHIYALDFDPVQTPGTYSISLGGNAPASSPSFVIAPAATLYRQPLQNALSFFQNERDGPQFIPSALRSAAAHLNDRVASTYFTPRVNAEGEFAGDLKSTGVTIDASGGWWDAGDYLKFVETASYTVALQLTGARDFPALMGSSAGASDFTAEARFGTEWLLRMWDDVTRTLYYQVGIGGGNASTASDHDIWRLPQADDEFAGGDPSYRYIRRRPVFRAGAPGARVSPNIAGREAAAFALCFQLFRGSAPALADRCLLAAEHIFELADTAPRGRLLTTLPFGFYPESEWRDDLELGAGELAVALGGGGRLPEGLPHRAAAYYLQAAAHWAKAYIARSGAGGEGLNLYDVSGLAHYELVRALRAAGRPAGLEVSEAQLIANLRAQLEAAVAQSQQDPFGFGFPWASFDTASHGDGLSVMASEYDSLTGSSAYGTYAARWLANVLGANAWGSSFIIGDGATFTDCPQHQVANLAGSLDGTSPVLAGAVVEGPNAQPSRGLLEGMRPCPAGGGDPFAAFDNKAKYRDAVQSYTTTEPAIDLTASSPLAFSWQIAGVLRP